MKERLVEDWLTKVNERSFQTPFSQLLIAEGHRVMRVGHGSHEHGKDVISIDSKGTANAYQLKGGDIDLPQLEKHVPQLIALVETQIEHPSLTGNPKHRPHFVITGQLSMPAEDRIRVMNAAWKRRKYAPLQTITGKELLPKFASMASDFWPQELSDSRNLLSLFLADGRGNLSRSDFARLLESIVAADNSVTEAKAVTTRRIAAANLFADYALAPFGHAQNHWELVQGWTMTAAHVAWAADRGKLKPDDWQPSFGLAVQAASNALNGLVEECLEAGALNAEAMEIDETTRARCTICAAAIAAKILIDRIFGRSWSRLSEAQECLNHLMREGRIFFWGESSVPLMLMLMWGLDTFRADQASESLLKGTIFGVTARKSRSGIDLENPYTSADTTIHTLLQKILERDFTPSRSAHVSYTLEATVSLAARRLLRQFLNGQWAQITRIQMMRNIPDSRRDLLLWNWRHKRGTEHSALPNAPQSWQTLLAKSRVSDDQALPAVLKNNLDFATLFALAFPHRFGVSLAKFLDRRFGDLG